MTNTLKGKLSLSSLTEEVMLDIGIFVNPKNGKCCNFGTGGVGSKNFSIRNSDTFYGSIYYFSKSNIFAMIYNRSIAIKSNHGVVNYDCDLF